MAPLDLHIIVKNHLLRTHTKRMYVRWALLLSVEGECRGIILEDWVRSIGGKQRCCTLRRGIAASDGCYGGNRTKARASILLVLNSAIFFAIFDLGMCGRAERVVGIGQGTRNGSLRNTRWEHVRRSLGIDCCRIVPGLGLTERRNRSRRGRIFGNAAWGCECEYGR